MSFGCHDVKSILNILKETCKLPYLRNLELFGQQVEYLPEEIWNYVPEDVKFVNFSGTSIRNLPKGISKLQNLEKLYFYTPIEDLPKDIESLPNLKEVILPINHKLGVTRFLSEADFENVESLDLSNKRLDRVLCDIVKLKNLKKLNLSDNNLRSIPLFLRNMENLETLYISSNNIASLPTKTWPFPRTLNYLKINSFLLKDIPDDRIESIELSVVDVKNVINLNLIRANGQRIGNKQIIQNLGGVCVVKLREPAKYNK